MNLRTARLLLVPASADHVRAELAGGDAFETMLGAAVPPSWPPGEYDAGAQAYFLERLTAAGEEGVGWYGWYAVRDADAEAPATVVAGGGYLGPPSEEGGTKSAFADCAPGDMRFPGIRRS